MQSGALSKGYVLPRGGSTVFVKLGPDQLVLLVCMIYHGILMELFIPLSGAFLLLSYVAISIIY